MKKIKFKAMLIFLCLSVVLCSFSACQKEEPKVEYNYHLGIYELATYNWSTVGIEPDQDSAIEYNGEIEGESEINNILREYIDTLLGETLCIADDNVFFRSTFCPYGTLSGWDIRDTSPNYVRFDNEPAQTLKIQYSAKIYRHFPDYVDHGNYIDYYRIDIKTIPHYIEALESERIFYFEYRKPIDS